MPFWVVHAGNDEEGGGRAFDKLSEEMTSSPLRRPVDVAQPIADKMRNLLVGSGERGFRFGNY